MAHELSIVDGKASMAFVGEMPWHGLGSSLDASADLSAWMEASKTNFVVKQANVIGLLDGDDEPIASGDKMNVGVFADGSRKNLGIVGPNTDVLQNQDAFEWFNPFIEAGVARWETMGALGEFTKVWGLARLGTNDVIKDGDEIARYLMLSNSHDGSTAIRIGFTPIRIVCANTLGLAHRSKSSKLMKISHARRDGKGGIKASMEMVRNTIDAANSEFVATAEQYRLLAQRKNIDSKSLEKYVRIVFKMDEECPKMELPPQSRTRLNDIAQLFETGKGNEGKSWWDAYNAVTEFTSWYDGKKSETRMEKLWFGTNVAKVDESLALALTLSA